MVALSPAPPAGFDVNAIPFFAPFPEVTPSNPPTYKLLEIPAPPRTLKAPVPADIDSVAELITVAPGEVK